MDRDGALCALRWCITRVDASLVALENVGNEIYGYALKVDEVQRVVRSGVKTPIKRPPTTELPDDAELIHASQVEDAQLAMPVTLLVFRCRASDVNCVALQRPTKRARRDPSATQPNSVPATSTRLLFFALTSGGINDWELQSLGDVALHGAPSAFQIHVVGGPHVVAFNTATSELSLLQASVTDEGDYAFAVTYTGLTLPGTSAQVELLSCQLMGEELTPAPHLLLQYAECQQPPHDEGVITLGWQHASERRRLWVTLQLLCGHSIDMVILPCTYIPSSSMSSSDIGVAEQITSCVFVAPPSSSRATRQPPVFSPTTLPLEAPRLHASVVMLTGTSSSTLRVATNDMTLASYVVAGVPHRIQITNSHQDSGSTIVVVVSCLDTDRSLHVLSIDVWGDRKRVVMPLQHFTHVGSLVDVVFDNDVKAEHRMLLVNDVDLGVEASEFLALALRKSVVVSCSLEGSSHATSSCHRLKHRADEKTRKNRGGGGREDQPGGGLHSIERVKIDRRERDLDIDSRSASNHSSASEQQLGMLTKSLEERLRVGCVQSDRLEKVCGEKMEMVARLNDLLTASYELGNDLIASIGGKDSPLELIRVVGQDQSFEDKGSSPLVKQSRNSFSAQHNAALDNVSIVSFERSSSILRLSMDVYAASRAMADSGDDVDVARAHFSAYASHNDVALRSWSRVRRILPPHQGRSSQRRIRIDVQVEVPTSYRRLRNPSFKFGLWLRMTPPAMNPTGTKPSPLQVSCWFMGEAEANLISLAENVAGGYPGRFVAKTEDNFVATKGDYLILSGGSSIRKAVAVTQASSESVRFAIVRSLFGIFSVESAARSQDQFPDDHGFCALLRALPSDVVALVNPLSKANLEMLRDFIRLLQTELDQLFLLDAEQGVEKKEPSEDTRHIYSLAKTQQRTDLQALRLLNELQWRINFHALQTASSQ